MFAPIALLAALVAPALAGPSITAPVATTTWTAGQQQTITWMDNGMAPTLKDFSNAVVSIYAGNAIQQTKLQEIVASVDVSTTSSITFTPDPSIGPSGAYYFIRMDSLVLKDANNTQYPAQSFSAKFMLTGMSGQFNATVQQQVDGASTAPIGGTPAATTPAATSAPATTTPGASKPASSASKSSAAPSGSASAAGKSANGAVGVAVNGLVALVGTALTAAFML
jgi:hypothetical protein